MTNLHRRLLERRMNCWGLWIKWQAIILSRHRPYTRLFRLHPGPYDFFQIHNLLIVNVSKLFTLKSVTGRLKNRPFYTGYYTCLFFKNHTYEMADFLAVSIFRSLRFIFATTSWSLHMVVAFFVVANMQRPNRHAYRCIFFRNDLLVVALFLQRPVTRCKQNATTNSSLQKKCNGQQLVAKKCNE